VQAHPFRQRHYIKRVVLSTGCVDGVEIANGGNDAEADALACRYAKIINKPMLAGSDIHDASMIYTGEIFGVYLDKKLCDIKDYVNVICNNEIAGLKADQTRFDLHGDENVITPVDVRDENDRIISNDWKEYI